MKEAQIAQGLLDEMSQSITQGDFEAYKVLIHLPIRLSKAGRTLVISNEAELRNDFDAFQTILSRANADEYELTSQKVLSQSPDRLAVLFLARTKCRSVDVLPKYRNWVTLKRINQEGWRASSILSFS